jgi:hypothetical protein
LPSRYTSLIKVGCFACTMVFCGTPDGQAAQANAMQVELDAFSGRPNPVWELRGGSAEKILERLRKLQPAPQSSSDEAGLGYRGFVLRPNGGSLNGYDEIRIIHGRVFARHAGRSLVLSDNQGTLEQMLLESAKPYVSDAAMQYIRGEIRR